MKPYLRQDAPEGKPKGDWFILQVRDDDGFWCNVTEVATAKQAIRMGEARRRESDQSVRVVKGRQREVVREWS